MSSSQGHTHPSLPHLGSAPQNSTLPGGSGGGRFVPGSLLASGELGEARSQALVSSLALALQFLGVLTTSWGLWEKWNGMRMLHNSLENFQSRGLFTRATFEQYRSLKGCFDDKVDEAVDTLKVVSLVFKVLHYGAYSCARPTVPLAWMYETNRCVRASAKQHVVELSAEICSAQYGDSIFGVVDILQDEGAAGQASHACECLKGHSCDSDGGCWVAEDGHCVDKTPFLGGYRGYYSREPCMDAGPSTKSSARAHSLLLSICTVCNHGFFENAGKLAVEFWAGAYGEACRRDLADPGARLELRRHLESALGEEGVDVGELMRFPHTTEESPPEQAALMALVRYERLMLFSDRCEAFKATLGTDERAQMIGEDLLTEKTTRLSVDGRIGQVMASVVEYGGKAWRQVGTLVDESMRSIWHDEPSPHNMSEIAERAEAAAGGTGVPGPASGEGATHVCTDAQRVADLGSDKAHVDFALSSGPKSVESLLQSASGQVQAKTGWVRAIRPFMWLALPIAEAIGPALNSMVVDGYVAFEYMWKYLYNMYSVYDSASLLTRLDVLSDKFSFLTSMVTIFAYIATDAAYTHFNLKMCPKVASIIELVGRVRRGDSNETAGMEADPSHHAAAATDPACDRAAERAREDLRAQLAQRAAAARRLRELRSAPPGEILSSSAAPEDRAKLLQMHDQVTDILAGELQPAVLCKSAGAVLEEPWDDLGVGKTLSEHLPLEACRAAADASCAEPAPAACAHQA